MVALPEAASVKSTLLIFTAFFLISMPSVQDPLSEFRDPPREYSVMPFWFWNDELGDDEIIRQIGDFEAHGVYGFIIHPRIGLPKDIGWLSNRMIRCMRIAVEEARKRRMYVILYDEGMYPSGSSSGQVVRRNPAHAARSLDKIDLNSGEEPTLPRGWNLVTIVKRPGGRRLAVVDRPSGGLIRGLHYLSEDAAPKEETPPAGDILNPEAVASFMALVYERYSAEFGQYFGSTIIGIFTDEPSMTGRGGKGIAGTTGIVKEVNRILGYDFTPYLADLWYNDSSESKKHRDDYHRAVSLRLEETYYRPLSEWCGDHKIALAGHPAGSMDIGIERYFQFPGQDLVWRYVEPGPKALEGEHSTMAKCASSAMIHLGRRRNSNELYGAYGHNLTFNEMQWLANWCFVRGQNLLYPHAFYYSIRGPRFDERPPDVGPNAAWWKNYKPYADACRRLSWINAGSKHVCDVAILATASFCPDKAAKVLYQHQRDFNYLDVRHLWEDAKVDTQGVHVAGMHYRTVILDGFGEVPERILPALEKLAGAGLLIGWNSISPIDGERIVKTSDDLVGSIQQDLILIPQSGNIRYRHVQKSGLHFYILFNEESSEVTAKISVPVPGKRLWLSASTGTSTNGKPDETVSFAAHELKIMCILP
jgi:hypothetical protein